MTGRIATLTTTRLSVPLHTPFVTALRRTLTTDTLVVRLTDDDGVTGWGEAPQVWQVTGDSLPGAEACLAGPLRPVLVGADPDDPDLPARLQRAVVGNRAALMAADVALHDLRARRAGVPLHEHLAVLAGPAGLAAPRTASVVTDVTLAAGDLDALVVTAAARVADGFGVLKLKVGADPDPAADVRRVRAVREAVGPDVVLRLDANQAWRADTAVEVITALEDAGAGVELVEQPTARRDVLGLAHVRRHVETPVLADEAVFDLDDLVEVLRADAADAVNVKLAKCGGLTPALELLDVARRHGLGTVVGSMMETHVGLGAAAALVAAVGTTLVPDLDAAWWAASSPYAGGPTYDRDRVRLPDRPGLGVDRLLEESA